MASYTSFTKKKKKKNKNPCIIEPVRKCKTPKFGHLFAFCDAHPTQTCNHGSQAGLEAPRQ